MITPQSTGEEVLACLLHYFNHQLFSPVTKTMYHALEHSTCQCATEDMREWGGMLRYSLTLFVPLEEMKHATVDYFESELCSALRHFIHDDETIDIRLNIKTALPSQQLTTGVNNCYFKREQTILHDELRFRSRGEIVIYDELKKRNVLFFPNPAAVLGTAGTEYGEEVKKREPDFLICCNGKWGMLEINGDDFHSGIVKTTKDHERARLFNHYGLFFIQVYYSGTK